jgi:hypothetical protein
VAAEQTRQPPAARQLELEPQLDDAGGQQLVQQQPRQRRRLAELQAAGCEKRLPEALQAREHVRGADDDVIIMGRNVACSMAVSSNTNAPR